MKKRCYSISNNIIGPIFLISLGLFIMIFLIVNHDYQIFMILFGLMLIFGAIFGFNIRFEYDENSFWRLFFNKKGRVINYDEILAVTPQLPIMQSYTIVSRKGWHFIYLNRKDYLDFCVTIHVHNPNCVFDAGTKRAIKKEYNIEVFSPPQPY